MHSCCAATAIVARGNIRGTFNVRMCSRQSRTGHQASSGAMRGFNGRHAWPLGECRLHALCEATISRRWATSSSATTSTGLLSVVRQLDAPTQALARPSSCRLLAP